MRSYLQFLGTLGPESEVEDRAENCESTAKGVQVEVEFDVKVWYRTGSGSDRMLPLNGR